MALSGIRKLAAIAEKPSRLIIGLMSGTSLDGLDLALCRITGSGPGTKVELLNFRTLPYAAATKDPVLKIFANRNADLELVCRLNAELALVHSQYVLDTLAEWDVPAITIDCIASHGQTIYHAPGKTGPGGTVFGSDSTLQIGDGDLIAVKTGILTVSDFRQKHIAAGGEGAPLALYGDRLLFSAPAEDRVLLNIGGISNFTFLPAQNDPGIVIATDTGPGNTLMDAFVRKNFDLEMDENAAIASTGECSSRLLDALLAHPFFSLPFPKTTGPELFNLQFVEEAQQRSGTELLALQDILATLCRFTVATIASAINSVGGPGCVLYLSGGGSHNPLLVRQLAEELPGFKITDLNVLGIDPDAKEAVLFAVLANEMISGEPGEAFAGSPAVTMGKISFPC